jgi:GNAT superfamily N-acetyltransferase
MVIHPRMATKSDSALLGELNHQLIQDEGHRNRMTIPQLQERMRGWLAGEYAAVLFENESEVVAYALYREEPDLIYLRQLFVRRYCRRRGLGREAIAILRNQIWPAHKRLTVEVLTVNADTVAFWKSVGFQEYCLTLEIMPVAT